VSDCYGERTKLFVRIDAADRDVKWSNSRRSPWNYALRQDGPEADFWGGRKRPTYEGLHRSEGNG
jgi:hypothetical protein